ncbi:sigma-70 family RNA polymerase sigma factor [Actinomadura madurae]|uniref:sigma-70 family RNA polymerase sigma factor n=1 Tax=Actinomadura madurae TaxID=1993 RepID=UPI0020D217DD|nr:sigma-70 family RNA polymerase sigma factor [Actinomadura madurae]MCP9947381.1 sigma-70 family RNA polymerase sigma factor [Actinomadura madurae]MCQ0011886.1 sigma-70 family RNA polymerase sigma factor [Actinomadura madurae]
MEATRALSEADWETHRPAVFGAAYRILGTVTEAEDVTQEVWLRAAAADLSEVRDLRAWLVTVAARTSYNVLNSARVRRESYVGPWLPEPLLTGPDAAARVLMDESVSTAMLVVMEALTPAERVALVLHDVFGFPFDRIAEVLGATPAAGRKLASRARARVAAVQERPTASRAETERVLKAFRAAAEAGDVAGLVELLDPEAVYVADGGGKVTAARKPVRGAERIAVLAIRQIGLRRPDAFSIIEVNGRRPSRPTAAASWSGSTPWRSPAGGSRRCGDWPIPRSSSTSVTSDAAVLTPCRTPPIPGGRG